MGGQTQDGFVWQDAPEEHFQGIAYEKLQELLQTYPVDRKQMEGYSWTDRFVSSCAKFSAHQEAIHKDSLNEDRDKTKSCVTVLHKCREFDAKGKALGFCPSAAKDRRYDYMEVGNKYMSDRIYGRNYRECQLETFHPDLTSVCLCECESSETEADRYFSLKEVVADEDKVVTGVTLKKDKHMFSIRIQRATLGPNSTIVGKAKWKLVDEMDMNNLLSVYSNPTIKSNGDVDVEFDENDSFYAITSEQNTILLDDLQAGAGEVVTGVRFRQIGKDLRLEIQLRAYDIEYGDLSESSRWLASRTDRSSSKPVNIEIADIPTDYKETNVFSGPHQYVQFQASDFKKDLGQTTVPFIDYQDVTSEPASPLFALGIFHKGNQQSAGFIALRGKWN